MRIGGLWKGNKIFIIMDCTQNSSDPRQGLKKFRGLRINSFMHSFHQGTAPFLHTLMALEKEVVEGNTPPQNSFGSIQICKGRTRLEKKPWQYVSESISNPNWIQLSQLGT